MKLFALPTEFLVFNLLGMLFTAALAVSCVCRVNASSVTRGRVTLTQLMYLAFAFWAFGTFVELACGSLIGFHNAAVGLGLFFHLTISYPQWREEDPVCHAVHMWLEPGSPGHAALERAFADTQPMEYGDAGPAVR